MADCCDEILEQIDDLNEKADYIKKYASGGGTGTAVPYDGLPLMDGEANPGSYIEYSRGNHVHPSDTSKVDVDTFNETISNIQSELVNPSDDTPLMDGDGSAGTSSKYSRGDHKHPSDTNKVDVDTFNDTIDTLQNEMVKPSDEDPLMDGDADAGSKDTYSRGDHKHPSDTSKVDVETYNSKINELEEEIASLSGVTSPSDDTPIMDGEGVAGSSSKYSRGDHQHPSDTSKVDIETFNESIDSLQSEISSIIIDPSDEDPLMDGEADAGSSSKYSRGDHRHPSDESKVDTETFNESISNLQSEIEAITIDPSDDNPLMDGEADAGTDSKYARGDHRHPSDTTKVDIDTFNDAINDLQSEIDASITVDPSDDTPLMDGEGSAGIQYLYSRGDHQHPSDTSKVDVDTFNETVEELELEIASISGGASPSNENPLMDGVETPGISDLYSRGDHRHPSDDSKVNVDFFNDTIEAIYELINEGGGGGTTANTILSDTITVELGSGATVGGYSTGDIIEEGTTVQTILNTLFMKQVPPTYTKPSMSLSLSPSTTTYEIGTSLTDLAVGVNFNQNDAGAFSGCTFTCSDGTAMESISTTSEKSYWSGIITSSVTFSGTLSYEEGAIKKDNLGNDYPTGHIEAGSLTASTTISGVRYSFYKSSGSVIDYSSSSAIRSLGNSASNLKKGSTVNIAINTGDMYVVFAYPKSLGELSTILQQSSNLDVKGSFDIDTVSVEGAEGYTAEDYYVYHYAALAGLNSDTFTVTI